MEYLLFPTSKSLTRLASPYLGRPRLRVYAGARLNYGEFMGIGAGCAGDQRQCTINGGFLRKIGLPNSWMVYVIENKENPIGLFRGPPISGNLQIGVPLVIIHFFNQSSCAKPSSYWVPP